VTDPIAEIGVPNADPPPPEPDPLPDPEHPEPVALPDLHPVTDTAVVLLANLHYGRRNRDVADLQKALNDHFPALPALPITGYYGVLTDVRVRYDQQWHLPGVQPDKAQRSRVGQAQAAHLGLNSL